MLGLIKSNLPATGENDRCQTAPTLFFDCTAVHFLLLQPLHGGFQVVTQEVQLVRVIYVGGMKRNLGWRQREDEPAMAGVYRRKFENITKESAVAFRILAVNDDVGTP
jgi:hypothetical protein